ncbi:MAG: hypothetical protein PHT91_03745 [Candidatus Nanoarchaeia archaeon]|nr:hypothetical protein [Candidatus Nanoarchaeia archaeon]MDD5054129.1 hypothetical protein [Candidatus Nanoarchaeia archaeon]MDD5499957.1 hypothetical protein [Candidatus Nanoarchaeia archaeon]
MQEVGTSGAGLTAVIGSDFSVNGSSKKDKFFFRNGEYKIVFGNKTFALLGDSTHYPDPSTLMVVFPKSELKINVRPWEFIDKAKGERTTGFRIADIELIRGIFMGDTGANVKAGNAKVIFSKKKGKIKIELTGNAIYAGGNDAELSGSFSKKPLKLTQFSEYIIVGNNYYKKSMMAAKEENFADERFIRLDSFFLSILSLPTIKQLDKTSEAISKVNPNDILKNLENAMNLNPEILKHSGLSGEQAKQAGEMMARFKKEVSGKKFEDVKSNLLKINTKTFVKASEKMKEEAKKVPEKIKEIIMRYESLPSYGKLPGKFGECEEAEV